MNNPLAKRDTETAAVRNSEEDLRAWCWSKNEQCRNARFPHWLYVSRDRETNILTCKTRTGADALDVLKVLDGWYHDFKGWDQDRLDSEFRILRHMARMGMTEEKFASIRFANPPRPIAA